MVELDWSPEQRQVDTSRPKPLRCSPVPVFLTMQPEWNRELKPLNCQMTSDFRVQQPGPRRSRYGRLLKLRKRLNDSSFFFQNQKVGSVANETNVL
ncbi:hypothetical protein TNCT_242191 [Trichonephila clavata]|uniref:Uncharacterized protein n=1 Tax=Trichonephila clavata TaxID=2740835 RepID=A0A8X6I6I2_TRICU|nr:hypothetical protein TNCT_242191 [Trichonephila clavata]